MPNFLQARPAKPLRRWNCQLMVFGGAPAPTSPQAVLQAQYFDAFMPNAGQGLGPTNPYSSAIQAAMLAANSDVVMVGYVVNGGITTKKVGQTDPADGTFTYTADMYVRSAMVWNTGGSPDTGDPTRSPLNTPYVVGDMVIPSSGWDGVTYWRCTVQGTPGASEPSWPATPTPEVTTQTDGTVTWLCTLVPPSAGNGCTVLTSTGGGTANAAMKMFDPRWKAEIGKLIALRAAYTSGTTPMAVMDGMLTDVMGLEPAHSMNTPGYNPFKKAHFWFDADWQATSLDLLAAAQSFCSRIVRADFTCTAHGLSAGGTVTIASASPASWNITNAAVASVTDANHFSIVYPTITAPVSFVSGTANGTAISAATTTTYGTQYGGNSLYDGVLYYGAVPTKRALNPVFFSYAQEWLRVDSQSADVYPSESEWRCDVNMLIDEEMNQHPLFIGTALWPLAATDVTHSKAWHKFSYASFGMGNDSRHWFQFRDDNVHFTYDGTSTLKGRQTQYKTNYYSGSPSADGFDWWDNLATFGTPTDFWRSSATISAATAVGAVATFTTSLQHGYQVGDQVAITGMSPAGYNTAGSTIATVPSTTTFTMTLSAAPGASTVMGTSTGPGAGRARAITGLPVQTKTAVYVTTTPHGFAMNDSVTITGSSNGAFNITGTVKAIPNSTTFGLQTFGGSGTSSGGTATDTTATLVATIAASGASTQFVTVCTTAANHNFNVGDPVSITGYIRVIANTSINPSGYNVGAYVCSTPTANTFGFLMTFTPGGTSQGPGSAIAQGQVGDHIAKAQQVAGHYVRKYTGGVLAVNPTANTITNATITGLLASHTYTDIDNTTYVTSGGGVLTIASMGAGTGYLLRA